MNDAVRRVAAAGRRASRARRAGRRESCDFEVFERDLRRVAKVVEIWPVCPDRALHFAGELDAQAESSFSATM